MTSAEMNKEIKRLQSERSALIEKEKKVRWYKAATTEDPETCKPEYDLVGTGQKLSELEFKIRDLKHRLNVFNTTYTIPALGMTIDQVLVYLPQLTCRIETLKTMASHLPKARVEDRYGSRSTLVEYEYTNYDPRLAQTEYDELVEELSSVQLLLDKVNNSVDIPF